MSSHNRQCQEASPFPDHNGNGMYIHSFPRYKHLNPHDHHSLQGHQSSPRLTFTCSPPSISTSTTLPLHPPPANPTRRDRSRQKLIRKLIRILRPTLSIAHLLLRQQPQRHLHNLRIRLGVRENGRTRLLRGELLDTILAVVGDEADAHAAFAAGRGDGEDGLRAVEGRRHELFAEHDLGAVRKVVAEDGHFGAASRGAFRRGDFGDGWWSHGFRVGAGGVGGGLVAVGVLGKASSVVGCVLERTLEGALIGSSVLEDRRVRPTRYGGRGM